MRYLTYTRPYTHTHTHASTHTARNTRKVLFTLFPPYVQEERATVALGPPAPQRRGAHDRVVLRQFGSLLSRTESSSTRAIHSQVPGQKLRMCGVFGESIRHFSLSLPLPLPPPPLPHPCVSPPFLHTCSSHHGLCLCPGSHGITTVLRDETLQSPSDRKARSIDVRNVCVCVMVCVCVCVRVCVIVCVCVCE